MNSLLRSLIRETLLVEEVYGAQAVVYHGTEADPRALIDALLKDKFIAGAGSGAMYGKGLYTVYDLAGTQTEKGNYGDHVIKLKVNLYGYIIFDPDTALKVYKRPLTPAQQAEEVGYSDDVVKALRGVRTRKSRFTSDAAEKVHESLQYEVKGLVFTGESDGRVVVVYDPTTAVPMAWKRVGSSSWTPVDRAALLTPLERPDVSDREGRPVRQSSLARSALGDFETGKWDAMKTIRRLERLPEDQRVVNGDLDIENTLVASLPPGLRVGRNLNISRTPITELPSGLRVDGNLYLNGTKINSLPSDLRLGGSLYMSNTRISSLPPGLEVVGDLRISHSPITSLPAGLKVRGFLDVSSTSVTSLPADLQVGDDIYGLDRRYWDSVPEHLRSKLH